MDTQTYTEVRKNFATVMNSVCENHRPLLVTRQKNAPVVILSLEDYNSLEETLYLLQNPQNASRLMESVAQIKEGQPMHPFKVDDSE